MYAGLQKTWFLKYEDNDYGPKRSPPPPPRSGPTPVPVSKDFLTERAPPSAYLSSA